MDEMSPAQTVSLTNSECHESMGDGQVGNIARLKLVSDAGKSLEISVLKGDSNGIIQECEEGVKILNASSDHEMKTNDVVNSSGGSKRQENIFGSECVPLWGSVCICGRRPEMEDSISVAPWPIRIPIKLLVGHSDAVRMSHSGSHIPGHFFAVYDGHGGSQVANYCRGHIHRALEEELELTNDDFITDNCLEHWEATFTSCFVKVDDEVAGNVQRENASEPFVAPPTVGSTATVALICSSHLIVANCGDSRAVLCRGKAAIPLSVDHKPNREDEYARIEASGGRVIQWNGHRVLGVLAMSRSIGDRYLKPWIIPNPEVRFVMRTKEDECIIIGSDGLWDVIGNEEACEVARKRILMWYKKNVGGSERGKGGVDAAAQGAAEYLSALALQKGSKDNISVIVVDLKTHRKFKKRS